MHMQKGCKEKGLKFEYISRLANKAKKCIPKDLKVVWHNGNKAEEDIYLKLYVKFSSAQNFFES